MFYFVTEAAPQLLKYWNKKKTKPLIHIQSKAANHLLKANKPTDQRLFSLFVFAAAAAATCWILLCSNYFLHSLDHKTRSKYGTRHLTFAESKLLMNIHSCRQFCALKVKSPSRKRNRDIYEFMQGHLGMVNDDLYWFAVMQIFTKAMKR